MTKKVGQGVRMTTDDIRRNFELLGQELVGRGVTGEIVVAGGAAMLLVIRNRDTTRDVDAYFATNPQEIRAAAAVVARKEGLPPHWLNDGVKGFFYSQPPTSLWAEYPGLRLYTVDPDYLLAMKVLAARPQDVGDITALVDYIGLSSAPDILAVVQRYIPASLLSPRSRYLVEDLMARRESDRQQDTRDGARASDEAADEQPSYQEGHGR
ncbi:MAG: hypothetical protein M3Y74_08245 [Chloroflexota bacterium]|jgi:hypothetical protein|nr:hypothetical protein [Chloroflexota bacterium]